MAATHATRATPATYVATTQRFQSGHAHFAAYGEGPQGSRTVVGEAIFRASTGPLCSGVLRPGCRVSEHQVSGLSPSFAALLEKVKAEARGRATRVQELKA